MRDTLSQEIERECGIRLSYTDILIKATARILQKYPLFNATFETNKIVILADINVGLAVALEDGLIVPVLRNVERMELTEIVRMRKSLIEKARNKKLMLDDIMGGTFTISNLGAYEIDSFTSIINPPEVGILSVSRIRERAVVENHVITIKPVMAVGLSADHRVVDGAMAASFLQDLKRLLESPYLFIR
jgi:pyruvate dehydrogenase E2 component (dihydrolipoamide acetyltransferase)